MIDKLFAALAGGAVPEILSPTAKLRHPHFPVCAAILAKYLARQHAHELILKQQKTNAVTGCLTTICLSPAFPVSL
jgi:hypothetical protein